MKRISLQPMMLVLGAVLVVLGIIGFITQSSFTTGNSLPREEMLNWIAVNGWLSIIYLIAGIAAIGAAYSQMSIRAVAWCIGAVFLVLAIWGFAIGNGEAILEAIPVNEGTNIVNLIIGICALLIGMAAESMSWRSHHSARPV